MTYETQWKTVIDDEWEKYKKSGKRTILAKNLMKPG